MKSTDFIKEIDQLNKSLESIDAHITDRLIKLCKLYPDVVLYSERGFYLHAADVYNYPDYKFKDMTQYTRLSYMRILENHANNISKHKQLNLDL